MHLIMKLTLPRCRFPLTKIPSTAKFSSVTQKPQIVIVGTGWAGYRVALELDKSIFDVHVISPRNHFLFTPLLPSTAVGTLEFRAIQEPVRTIPSLHYYQAFVDDVDFNAGVVMCRDAFKEDSHQFQMKYDGIIIATVRIRNRLIDCFERASSPGADLDEIKKLLTFVIVGGGPTSVEFAAELYDFLKNDVSRLYPDLHKYCQVELAEASGHILGAFQGSLVGYVESLFRSRNIKVLTNTAVKAVDGNTAKLSDGSEISFGLMVWSTGVQQVEMVTKMDSAAVAKSRNGRIEIDPGLRILSPRVPTDSPSASTLSQVLKTNAAAFALGDCACDAKKPLPALAQVAQQQGAYLAAALNQHGLEATWRGGAPPFAYKHLGSMASVGEWKGVMDTSNIVRTVKFLTPSPPPNNNDATDTSTSNPGVALKGFVAFALWRAAYWTKQVSITNKILILMYWFKSAVFGRDISRF